MMTTLAGRQPSAAEDRASRPWIASAAIALAVIAFLSLWIWLRNSESRALREMPAAERAALYQRTAEDLRTLCGPDRSADLADHCREQATFLLKFPECDGTCSRMANDVLDAR